MRRLLIRPGAIGDCILSLPALERWKADYTEVWVPSQVVPLVRFADAVQGIASTGLDALELSPRLIERLRSLDSIMSWYGSNREDFRETVRQLGLPFAFLPALPPAHGRIHAADFFLRQAGCDGPAIPRIDCPRLAADVRNSAVIHPFSGGARKNWPLEKYHELARRMTISVEWCAGPQEPLDGAVRFDNLYELACWLACARVYIGNDSGVTHLAAAAGAPVVAIFGPTDPMVWGPRGNVRVIHRPLEEISVDDVLDAIEKSLKTAC